MMPNEIIIWQLRTDIELNIRNSASFPNIYIIRVLYYRGKDKKDKVAFLIYIMFANTKPLDHGVPGMAMSSHACLL